MFKKKNHLVGLDIGSRTIKAAELTETKQGMRLENFGMIDIAPGLIEDGVIKDPETVADAIRQLMKDQDIREQNVAISIGGYSVIIKKIIVDTMSEEQLEEIINVEAEQYVPFDIDDVYVASQILGESPNNANKMDVLLVAEKKNLVNDYVELVRIPGLNPCIIDVEAFALQNIFETNYGTFDESVALIDIGASKTTLTILKGNTWIFTRHVSVGCGQIDEKVASLLDCDYVEAEKIKKQGESESISTGNLREIVSTVAADWSLEIQQALDFFRSENPEDNIKRIFLSGGGAHTKEFYNLLSQDVSAAVETIDPFGSLTINHERIDTSYLDSISHQAAICLGLSLRRVADA